MNNVTIPTPPTDRQIQVDVLNALDRDPLCRTAFGVTVSHGVVTLLGSVRSRREAWLAEQAVYSTPGVCGIANELEVEAGERDDDSALAEVAVSVLARHTDLEPGAVKVLVSHGFLTLCGVVPDMHQRDAAERAVRGLSGVRGVWNALRVVRAEQRMASETGREMCTV